MVEKLAEAEKKRDSRDSRPRNEKVKGVSSGPVILRIPSSKCFRWRAF
jgi:hypothetical protein